MHQVAVDNGAAHGQAKHEESGQQEQRGNKTDGSQTVHADGMTDQNRITDFRQGQANRRQGCRQDRADKHLSGKISIIYGFIHAESPLQFLQCFCPPSGHG